VVVGLLSIINETQIRAKEISISNLLYDPIDYDKNISLKKIKCFKKFLSVGLDKNTKELRLTLLNFKKLYDSEKEKYLSSLSKNHRSNKTFNLDENCIIKELRMNNYNASKSSSLISESFVYSFKMGCWKVNTHID